MGFSIFPKNFKLLNNHKCRNRRGSDKKLWNTGNQVLRQVNQTPPGRIEGYGMIPGVNVYELMLRNIESNPFRVNPQNYNSEEELLQAILGYAESFLNRSPTSLSHFSRYFRLMSKPDQPFPIHWFKPSYQQYLLHMNWYKTNYYNRETGEGFYGLKHRKLTMDTVLMSYGYPRGFFVYKLPPEPRSHDRDIPPPEIVYQMIRYNGYHKDKDVNKLFRYLFLFGFMVGPRPPIEITTMKLSDLHLEAGYIIVHEPKKYGSTRQVYLEESFLTGKTRMSLKNYVDHLRPKFTTQYSKDYLFIKYWDGKPLTRGYLHNKLAPLGKQIYPGFQLYSMRHWAATSMLIKSWLEKHPDPLRRTQKFLGHEKRDKTETYITQAEELFRRWPFNWRNWVLKHPNVGMGENPQKSKQRQKTFVSHGTTGEELSGPVRI